MNKHEGPDSHGVEPWRGDARTIPNRVYPRGSTETGAVEWREVHGREDRERTLLRALDVSFDSSPGTYWGPGGPGTPENWKPGLPGESVRLTVHENPIDEDPDYQEIMAMSSEDLDAYLSKNGFTPEKMSRYNARIDAIIAQSRPAAYKAESTKEVRIFPIGTNAFWRFPERPIRFPYWLLAALIIFAAVCLGLVVVSVYGGEIGP